MLTKLYLVDLHVHIKRRVRDTEYFAEEQIKRAIDIGLDAIAITEHNQYLPPDELQSLRDKYAPFVIYSGVEVNTKDREDILVFGGECVRAFLEVKLPWPHGSDELITDVRGHGGATCIAHPFRRRPLLTDDRKYPDAIEVRSRHTPVRHYKELCEVVLNTGLEPLCNSDAHKPRQLGGFFNVCSVLPKSDTELAECLQNNWLVSRRWGGGAHGDD